VFPLKDNIPTDRFPVVTAALIVANLIVYFLFQKGGLHGPSQQDVVDYGFIPYELTHPGTHCELVSGGQQLACGKHIGHGQPASVVTIFTSMFMHGGLLHIGGNMLFLWIFGNNVEDSMGRVKYLLFYLAGGLAAVALQTLVHPDAAVPTIGASGAIAAVLGAYIVLYPRARVVTLIFIILFFTIVELPALVVLGLWILLQILYGSLDLTHGGVGGGTAYFAHIGGFVFGLLVVRLLAKRRKAIPPRYPSLV
jgi:membrane associated rhomboid family serine protease